MSPRHPRIGDLLWVQPGNVSSLEEPHVGVVSKIECNTWGHKEKVFVIWQGEPAWNYHPSHGYSGANIHNLRHTFRIFREGVEIR